jgi:hypothetical protein
VSRPIHTLEIIDRRPTRAHGFKIAINSFGIEPREPSEEVIRLCASPARRPTREDKGLTYRPGGRSR